MAKWHKTELHPHPYLFNPPWLFGNLPLITTLTQTNALQLETSQAITAYVNPTANLKLVKMVLYPEEGSIAKTSVKTLLNSVDFTIFN